MAPSMADAEGAAPDPRAIEALLAFWAEAGVDAALGDAPVDRLAPASPRPAPSESPPRPAARAAAAASRPAPAPPSPAAVAAPDLSALEAAVAAFEGCALRSGSAPPVFARPAARTDVVVVAEAPTAEDEAGAAPFEGPAGALVRALLTHAGLGDRALFTQTVFWRPPGGGAPSPIDQAACLPFLERLIALSRPRALLVMGEAAGRGLLGAREPILKSRGGWTEWRARHEPDLALPAMPTLSPAFILARPPLRAAAWGDILSLAARVDREGSGP